MAQNITSLEAMLQRQQRLFPDGVDPELNDIIYANHGTGSQRDRVFTLGQIADLVGESNEGIEILNSDNLTSAKILEVYQSGKLPILRVGCGGMGNVTALLYMPSEIYKENNGRRRCMFYRFDEEEVTENNETVVHRKLYWYKFENIPSAGQGESSSNGVIDLTFISPEQIEMTNDGKKFSVKFQDGKFVVSLDGDVSISGVLLLTGGNTEDGNDRINLLGTNGHPIGTVRTNMMPDVVMSGHIESSDFLIVERQTADDYYAGREFVVFNNTDSDKHVRIFMVKKGSNGYEFVPDSTSAGVSGHKIMNVTVRPYCCRKIVYAGIYDAQNSNEGGFFPLE